MFPGGGWISPRVLSRRRDNVLSASSTARTIAAGPPRENNASVRPRRELPLAIALVVLLSLVTVSAPAAADDLATARESFEEGRAAFRARRYREAALAYERSAAALPHAASR